MEKNYEFEINELERKIERLTLLINLKTSITEDVKELLKNEYRETSKKFSSYMFDNDQINSELRININSLNNSIKYYDKKIAMLEEQLAKYEKNTKV